VYDHITDGRTDDWTHKQPEECLRQRSKVREAEHTISCYTKQILLLLFTDHYHRKTV